MSLDALLVANTSNIPALSACMSLQLDTLLLLPELEGEALDASIPVRSSTRSGLPHLGEEIEVLRSADENDWQPAVVR